MLKPIPSAWREYRFRNTVATVGLVLGAPVAVVFGILIKLWIPQYAEAVFVGLMVVWAVLWGWSAFRVVRWPCPRCGKAWLAHQEPAIGAQRVCSNCGLSLYESP